MTLAAIFAAVMMGFSACQPEDQPSTPGTEETPGTNDETPGTNDETPGTNDETPGTNEETPGEDDYKSPITIDGEFADWDNLEGVVVCNSDPEATLQGLKQMKVYADEVFINVLLDIDYEIIEDRTAGNKNPVSLYLSTSKEAGGYDVWSDMCIEYMLQGWCLNGDTMDAWTSGMHMWIGEVHGTGWDGNWAEAAADVLPESASTGSKIEIRLAIENLAPFNDTLGDVFYIGADVQQGWNSQGELPNGPAGEAVEMLEVAIVK